TLMGFFAGLFSFCVWTFTPPSPLAFVFTPFYSVGPAVRNYWSLAICFIPRILVGVVTGACFRLFTMLKWKNIVAYGLSGVLGSLTNTFLVLGGIYVFFGQSYADALNISYHLLLGIIGLTVLTSGIQEEVIGGAAAYAICFPIQKHMSHSFE
ncbi:MAG: ECF transporter S component, partial [Clostridiales bacterium]|nr:ECF transporter S component [Clostridiales bacterium]